MAMAALLEAIRRPTGVARDASVLEARELHVPWELFPVPVVDSSGKVRGELRVTADVFAIGSQEYPLRVPLTGPGAQALADRAGMLLPTSRIASLIYNAGTVVLAPRPMGPPQFPYDGSMMSTERFRFHNAWIEEQRAGRRGLVVGHKKDVVTSVRLAKEPGRVAIFGWFSSRAKALQPLQMPHEAAYADYSHGIRLVAPTMVLDGQERLVADVLRDRETAALLSDEGPLDLAACRYRPLSAPATRPKPVERAPAPAPSDVDGFLQARHFTATPGREVRVIVLHTTENPTRPGVADAVAKMFRRGDRQASAHYVVGPETTIACVAERDVAWAAPGANNNGVQVEMVGRAGYSAAEWNGPRQQAMLARAAKLVAGICRRHDIPVRLVDADGLLRGESGITTHVAASKAFKKSNHWDPGPHFPFGHLLALVEAAIRSE